MLEICFIGQRITTKLSNLFLLLGECNRLLFKNLSKILFWYNMLKIYIQTTGGVISNLSINNHIDHVEVVIIDYDEEDMTNERAEKLLEDSRYDVY